MAPPALGEMTARPILLSGLTQVCISASAASAPNRAMAKLDADPSNIPISAR